MYGRLLHGGSAQAVCHRILRCGGAIGDALTSPAEREHAAVLGEACRVAMIGRLAAGCGAKRAVNRQAAVRGHARCCRGATAKVVAPKLNPAGVLASSMVQSVLSTP